MSTLDKMRTMAAIVAELQAQYDAENHSTTSVDFMRQHGEDWMKRRKEILGQIEHARTEAIWALSNLLSADDRRTARKLLDTHDIRPFDTLTGTIRYLAQ